MDPGLDSVVTTEKKIETKVTMEIEFCWRFRPNFWIQYCQSIPENYTNGVEGESLQKFL